MLAKNSFIRFGMVLFFFYPVLLQAQEDPNNWDKLNLSSTTIAGTKVYYEKCFEPNLPLFEKTYNRFLTQRRDIEILKLKKEQIVLEINNILGVKDINTAIQEEAFSGVVDIFSSIKLEPFYLVKQDTIKNFLKSGGQLPNFEYDKVTDHAIYNPNINFTSESKISGNLEIAFLIESVETFEKDIKEFSEIFQLLSGGIICGGMIHEFTELDLCMYAKPGDPYWRWFTEGVANSLAYELVKKYIAAEDANDFIEGYNVNQYEDIKKEINLKYWMFANYCILSNDAPTKSDQKFSHARYSFATLEVRRLIEEHGIDCIKKIIDEIGAKESRTGDDLLITIRDVTGEDMYLRFTACQSFGKRQEGIEKYTKAYNEAFAKKDQEQMLFNLFRMHELHTFRFLSESMNILNDYRIAAALLFKMGFEKEADSAMQNCLEFFSKPVFGNGREAALEAFALYVIETGKPEKARDYADELLKTIPDNVAALTVIMMNHLSDNQLPQAKEIARKIINISKNKETSGYKIASQILAIDPNQTDLKQ